jgi:DNA-directed RNA polymerase subunit M/transcription elongation factor TFIIS
MSEIPSFVKPKIEALRKEVDDANRMARDTEDTIIKLDEQVEHLQEQIKRQRQHLENYKKLADNRTSEITSLETQYNIPTSKYDFKCEGCGKTHTESIYCMAQRASGHTIVFKCDCGHVTDLPPYKK